MRTSAVELETDATIAAARQLDLCGEQLGRLSGALLSDDSFAFRLTPAKRKKKKISTADDNCTAEDVQEEQLMADEQIAEDVCAVIGSGAHDDDDDDDGDAHTDDNEDDEDDDDFDVDGALDDDIGGADRRFDGGYARAVLPLLAVAVKLCDTFSTNQSAEVSVICVCFRLF